MKSSTLAFALGVLVLSSGICVAQQAGAPDPKGRGLGIAAHRSGNCTYPPCPWETNQWPWNGTLGGYLPTTGTDIVLLDAQGRTVSQAPVNQDGSYSLPAPRLPLQGPPRVCVAPPGRQKVCGGPGDNAPTLTLGGRQVQVTPIAVSQSPGESFRTRPGNHRPGPLGIAQIPIGPATTKMMTGKVFSVDTAANTFTIMTKDNSKIIFSVKKGEALPVVGTILDITYIPTPPGRPATPGGPFTVTNLDFSRINID
jgi:hypothetical protein